MLPAAMFQIVVVQMLWQVWVAEPSDVGSGYGGGSGSDLKRGVLAKNLFGPYRIASCPIDG